MKHPDVMKDLQSQMVRNLDGQMEFDGPTIIYCPTKKCAETLTNAVKGENIICFNRVHRVDKKSLKVLEF